MRKSLLFLSFILLLCTFSCENDDNVIPEVTAEEEQPVTPINFEENFGATVSARFLGRVVDEQNEPIQGATIRIGNTVATTDFFGIFSISDATAYEKFAYVTVEKSGYIHGSRALIPSTTEVNRVEIMLLKEDVIATVNSGEASTVNLPNGTAVTFDGNFVTANGTTHTGAVEVIVKHLSPDDENMEAMMPGMLFAQDTNGAAVTLETYGMLAVELQSTSGQALQLAAGSISQITLPVAANTVNPPATIPLWHFDETLGYWIEEGEATLQGNTYVGNVSHFSFWNIDIPYDTVTLCITLVDESGTPLPYRWMQLETELLNAAGTYGYTNSAGQECGLVPEGVELTVTIPSFSCNDAPFTTTIGPYTTDANTTITVTSNQNTTTLSGNFVNCDGAVITNGYVQLFIDGNSEIIPVTDGTIDYTISYCGTIDYSIKGIDVTNNQVTDVIAGTLSGEATLDLGTLSSCTGLTDSDGDGIFDTFEDVNGDNDLTNDDTDQDGIPNYLDADDDGDGVDTANEDHDGDGDPTNDDSDGDQIPDYLDPQDVIVFTVEVAGYDCDPVLFDLDAVVAEYGDNLHTYAFFLTEADAWAGTSPLSSPFGVSIADLTSNTQNIYVTATNIASGQIAVGIVYLYWNYVDTDGDGLTDCEELTGIDNPSTSLVPNGTSDPNDPNDPNPQPTIPTLSIEDVVLGEASNQALVAINLDIPSNEDILISIQSVTGSAVAGEDFQPINTTATIAAGETTFPIGVTLIDDTITEGEETFSLVVTVTSANTTNTQITSLITIIDNDSTQYPTEGEINACADIAAGTAIFDLTVMNDYFSNGPNGFTFVSYHLTEQDAIDGVNALSSPIEFADSTILYVRIADDTTTLQQVSLLYCNVNVTPNAPVGLSLTSCDGDGDSFATFQISQLIPDIVQANASLIVSFHETPQDAEVNVNALPNSSYTNIVIGVQTIYFRVEDASSGCYNVGSIELIVDSGC